MTEPVLNYEARRKLPRPRAAAMVLIALVMLSMLVFVARGMGGILMAHVWSLSAAGLPWDRDEENLCIGLTEAGQFAGVTTIPVLLALVFWMYRAHRRLRTFSRGRLGLADIEAVIGWIMPYRFIIRPYEVMREIYRVSRGMRSGAFALLCGCWWGFWLAAEFLNLAQWLWMGKPSERGADLAISYGVSCAVSAAPVLVSGACLLALIWRVDRAQSRRLSAP